MRAVMPESRLIKKDMINRARRHFWRMMFDEITNIPKEKYNDALPVRKFTHPLRITSLDRVGTMRLNQKQKKRMMFDDIMEIPEEKYGDAFSLRKFTHDELSMKPYIYLPHTITSIDGKQDLPFM